MNVESKIDNEFTKVFGELKRSEDVFCFIDSLDCLKELYEKKDIAWYAASVAFILQKITPNQMRRFYDYVKRLELVNRSRGDEDDIYQKYKIQMLLARIAGSSERENLLGLYKIVQRCIGKISDVKDLRAFVDFYEAILDYHATYKTEKN